MALNLINSHINIKEKEREKENLKEIKILSSNGIDENTAIVLDSDIDDKQVKDNPNYERQHAYYDRNRQKLLEYFHESLFRE